MCGNLFTYTEKFFHYMEKFYTVGGVERGCSAVLKGVFEDLRDVFLYHFKEGV